MSVSIEDEQKAILHHHTLYLVFMNISMTKDTFFKIALTLCKVTITKKVIKRKVGMIHYPKGEIWTK